MEKNVSRRGQRRRIVHLRSNPVDELARTILQALQQQRGAWTDETGIVPVPDDRPAGRAAGRFWRRAGWRQSLRAAPAQNLKPNANRLGPGGSGPAGPA